MMPQLIAQPLHGRARSRRSSPPARKRVSRRRTGSTPWSAARCFDRTIFVAGVEQQEIARAVGVLGLAGRRSTPGRPWRPAGRPRIPVMRHPRRRAARSRGVVPYASGYDDGLISGSMRRGMPKKRQQFVVPVQRLQVHQHGAAGVGHVGDVHAAARPAGEVPQHPGCRCVPKIASPFSAASRTPSTFSRIHWTLPAGEIRRGRQPGLAAGSRRPGRRGPARRRSGRSGCPARRSRCSRAGRCGGSTPRAVSRWLVMPSAARSAPTTGWSCCSADHDHRGGALPDLHRVVLDPARLRQDLLVFELVTARPRRRRGRRSCTGCWWCPGRWLRRSRPRVLLHGMSVGSIMEHTPRGLTSISRHRLMPRGGPDASCLDRLLRDRPAGVPGPRRRRPVDIKRGVVRALECTGRVVRQPPRSSRTSRSRKWPTCPTPRSSSWVRATAACRPSCWRCIPAPGSPSPTSNPSRSGRDQPRGELGERSPRRGAQMDATAIDAEDGDFDLAVFAVVVSPPAAAARVARCSPRAPGSPTSC